MSVHLCYQKKKSLCSLRKRCTLTHSHTHILTHPLIYTYTHTHTHTQGKEEILSFAVHPQNHEIATASRNLMIRYWDWRNPQNTHTHTHTQPPFPTTTTTTTYTPRCTRSFKAHETPVLALEYDNTGTLLATGSSDRTVKVWDVVGGYCTHNLRGHTGMSPHHLSIHVCLSVLYPPTHA